MRFVILVGMSVLMPLSSASAKTWFLGPGQDWEAVSPECKDAFTKADRHLNKGEFTRAARSYDKFLENCDPNSDLYGEALKRQFYIAEEYLAGRRKTVLGVFKIKGYAEGEKIMERISRRAGNAPIAMDAAVAVARSHEERGKSREVHYDLAYLKWSEIFDTYDRRARVASSLPTGEIGKDALLAMARCKHNAYRGPAYDACCLMGRPFGAKGPYESAKGCYEEFRSQYAGADDFHVDEKLAQISEQLARKDFVTGKYYQKTGNRQAANLYYQMVIRDWPGTKAARMAGEMLTENLGGEKVEK